MIALLFILLVVQALTIVCILGWCAALSARIDNAHRRADIATERLDRLSNRQQAAELVLFVDGKAAEFSAHLADVEHDAKGGA